MPSFFDIIMFMSPKVRHQNDVTKIFHFQAPPLAKSLLRSYTRCPKINKTHCTVFIIEADRYHFLETNPIFDVKFRPIISVADIIGHLL